MIMFMNIYLAENSGECFHNTSNDVIRKFYATNKNTQQMLKFKHKCLRTHSAQISNQLKVPQLLARQI